MWQIGVHDPSYPKWKYINVVPPDSISVGDKNVAKYNILEKELLVLFYVVGCETLHHE